MRPPAPFMVTINFKVDRRVGWDDDVAELKRHIDAVMDRLASSDAVEAVEMSADLDSATISLTVTVEAANQETAVDAVRYEIGEAIRESGAFHENLLPIKDESQLKSRLNAWAGLRTPRWQYRRLESTKV